MCGMCHAFVLERVIDVRVWYQSQIGQFSYVRDRLGRPQGAVRSVWETNWEDFKVLSALKLACVVGGVEELPIVIS